MRDVNRAFEAAVRRDPANWFWVHRRWKAVGNESRSMEASAKIRHATCQRHPPRILVRGTNWLGDAVMTTPALLRLREKFPEAHMPCSRRKNCAICGGNHPAVNETISFAPGESVFSVGKKLARRRI